MDKIEITDTMKTQGDLFPSSPIQPTTPPTWETLEAFYHASFPAMQVTPALAELGHTLNKCQVAYLENSPETFRFLLAKIYLEWVGLMSVVHREQGIGQETIDKELRRMLRLKVID